MTVSMESKNEDAGSANIANGTWFYLLDNTKIGEILMTKEHVNDPIHATKQQAIECAKALKEAELPPLWGEGWLKDLLIDFFENCDGFDTY